MITHEQQAVQPPEEPSLQEHRYDSHRPRSWVQRTTKRCFDLAGAFVGVLIFLPLGVAIAVAIRVSSPGPVLLRQTRVGAGGRPFTLYKFRTMFVQNDPAIHEEYYRQLVSGTAKPIDGLYKLANDPRITPVGRILRGLSLDELPQLWNVLTGAMSLVGPRPPLPYEVELYDSRAWGRLATKPGLTGLWQVSGRAALNFQQMVDLDLSYIQQWSFWLDLSIVLRTPLVIVTGRGAR